jgi:hypothetical protein
MRRRAALRHSCSACSHCPSSRSFEQRNSGVGVSLLAVPHAVAKIRGVPELCYVCRNPIIYIRPNVPFVKRAVRLWGAIVTTRRIVSPFKSYRS